MQTPQDPLKLRDFELKLIFDFGVEVVGIDLAAILHAVAEPVVDQLYAELFHQQYDVVVHRRDARRDRDVEGDRAAVVLRHVGGDRVPRQSGPGPRTVGSRSGPGVAAAPMRRPVPRCLRQLSLCDAMSFLPLRCRGFPFYECLWPLASEATPERCAVPGGSGLPHTPARRAGGSSSARSPGNRYTWAVGLPPMGTRGLNSREAPCIQRPCHP